MHHQPNSNAMHSEPQSLNGAAACADRDAKDSSLPRLAEAVARSLRLAGGGANVSWVRLYDTLAAMRAHDSVHMPQGFTDAIFSEIMHQVSGQPVHWLQMLPLSCGVTSTAAALFWLVRRRCVTKWTC